MEEADHRRDLLGCARATHRLLLYSPLTLRRTKASLCPASSRHPRSHSVRSGAPSPFYSQMPHITHYPSLRSRIPSSHRRRTHERTSDRCRERDAQGVIGLTSHPDIRRRNIDPQSVGYPIDYADRPHCGRTRIVYQVLHRSNRRQRLTPRRFNGAGDTQITQHSKGAAAV